MKLRCGAKPRLGRDDAPTGNTREVQIMAVLRQVETGERVADIGRKMGISQAAHYAWRKSRVRGERVASGAAATRRERPVEAVGGGLERKPGGSCRRSR